MDEGLANQANLYNSSAENDVSYVYVPGCRKLEFLVCENIHASGQQVELLR